MRRLLPLGLIAMLAAACTISVSTDVVTDGDRFDDVFQLVDQLSCGEVVTHFDNRTDATEAAALDLARELVGEDRVTGLLDGGEVWMIVNSQQVVFGGMNKGEFPTLSYCTGG